MNPIKFPASPVLLVDDEENFLHSLSVTLRSNSINNLETCFDSRKVIDLLSNNNFQLILLDLFMPYVSGDELLPRIKSEFPGIPVIILTAIDKVDAAVQCMKAGAFDYLVKPVSEEPLVACVRKAIENCELHNEIALLTHHLLSEHLEHPEAFQSFVAKSRDIHSIFKYVEAIAPTSLPVLITGETGTGKELIAKAIHTVSKRNGKFVPVNVAGLDDNLFCDTLFGHKKGAFTGAGEERGGLIKQAEGGTLFLDEIGDLKIESQVKLLRLLQDGKYYPVGSDIERFTNTRIVVATNHDIESLVKAETFRKDLFYRLKAHHIHIPPLRQRTEDIPGLVEHFLDKASEKLKKDRPTPPKELYVLLATYHFPGNVRELEGMVFDAVSRIDSKKLPLNTFKKHIGYLQTDDSKIIEKDSPPDKDTKTLDTCSGKFPTLNESEKNLIDEALKRSKGNQTIASEMLGISRAALYKRIKRSST